MREFDITLKKAFQVGLRPDQTNPRNQEALVECRNARVEDLGLGFYEDISQTFTITLNWPYTQLKRFQKDFLLFDETTVYTLDTSDWSKTSVISGASSGLSWHGADFIDFVVLTNGNQRYLRDPSTGAYSLDSSLPEFKTCCECNGRLIAGNISNFHDCDSSFVAWSRIGDTTFEPDRRQEANYSPAWSGEIYNVKKLGKGFIAYGARGIRAFQISGTQFEQIQIADFGIASRDAVGGDEKQHVLMDDNGELWSLTADLKLSRLGYKEFFSPMIGNDIVISYNPNPGEFYISDNNSSFLLYKGLTEIYQMVNSVVFYDGSKIGVISDSADDYFYLKTEILDFGIRGLKKIEAVELGIDTAEDLSIAVDYRYNTSSNWSTSSFKRVNRLGNGYVGVEANEFRLIVKAADKADVNLDYINIRFKFPDKRMIRGTYNVG